MQRAKAEVRKRKGRIQHGCNWEQGADPVFWLPPRWSKEKLTDILFALLYAPAKDV